MKLIYSIILPFVFLLISFFMSYIIYPVFFLISVRKKLHSPLNFRSSHNKPIPVLGGLVVYISAVISLLLYGFYSNNTALYILFVSLTLVVLVGVKDDLLGMKPIEKIFYQSLSVLILIFFTDFRFHFFDYWGSVMITVLFFMFVINSFNLIDGIDGLAGLIFLLFSGYVLIYSFFNEHINLSVISASLCGSIFCYLLYNLSSRKKIFMGDTGSMMLGFLVSYLFVSCFNHSLPIRNLAFLKSTSTLLILLFYPIIDVFRVLVLRVFILRVSPFKADNNHIHHKYIKFGLKHWMISVSIFSLTLVFTVVIYFLIDLPSFNSTILLFILFLSCLFVPIIFFNISNLKK